MCGFDHLGERVLWLSFVERCRGFLGLSFWDFTVACGSYSLVLPKVVMVLSDLSPERILNKEFLLCVYLLVVVIGTLCIVLYI